MANFSKLRAAQGATPSFVNEDGVREHYVVPIIYQREITPPGATDGPTTEGSLPLQASPPVPSVAPGGDLKLGRAWAAQTAGLPPALGTGGYCRIFPDTFSTAADIPDDWKSQYWTVPSPWCRIEGLPDHPEFEANLAAVEQQDEVKENK